MKFTLFGENEECQQLKKMMESALHMNSDQIVCSIWNDYDKFIHHYLDAPCDALFVTADGGRGLEVVNAGANLAPLIPRVWFAWDNNLGPQAMRMGTSFFAPKPVDEKIVEKALERCGIKGNYFRR